VTNLQKGLNFNFIRALRSLWSAASAREAQTLACLPRGATRLISWWMLHWWQVNGSTAREALPCIHRLTPNARLLGIRHDPARNEPGIPVLVASAQSTLTPNRFWLCR